MPRTATTFFQKFVFPNLPNISFHGIETAYYSEPFNKLQYSDDSFYNPSIFDDFIKNSENKNILISNEYLSGQSLYFNHINRTLIASRLKYLFPNAKILLVLRNQVDLLQSLYAVNVQWKETRPIDQFIWSNNQKNKLDSGGSSPAHYNTSEGYECLDGYDYNSLIKLYQDTFKNVTVLLFEEFIENPEIFIKKLAAFFDIDNEIIKKLVSENKPINEGVTKIQAEKLIKLNRFYELSEGSITKKRIYNKLKNNILKNDKKGIKPHFSSHKTIELKNHFKDLNLLLDKNYPEIEIKNYAKDYYLEP